MLYLKEKVVIVQENYLEQVGQGKTTKSKEKEESLQIRQRNYLRGKFLGKVTHQISSIGWLCQVLRVHLLGDQGGLCGQGGGESHPAEDQEEA